MCNFEAIKDIIRNKPIIFYNIIETDVDLNYFSQKDKFSFTIRKSDAHIFKKLSLVLIQNHDFLWFALVKNKQNISSLDQKINLYNIKQTKWKSIDDFKTYLSQGDFEKLKNYANNHYKPLSKKISECLLNLFVGEYCLFFENFKNIINIKRDNSILQYDAIAFAMSIAKMDHQHIKIIELNENETEIKNMFKLHEDTVITHEVHQERDNLVKNLFPTGKVVFQNQNEQLTIYTANKLPLESVFGVDLIYINDVHKNIIMIQYKMLKEENKKWLHRIDSQFLDEISRMDKVQAMLQNTPSPNIDDFRLNNCPFFLRFVKNRQQKNNHNLISLNISLEHFKMIQNLPICTGSRGGKMISYDNMNNHYIGKTELESLIRSGYIGTHQYDTNNLSKIIELISSGFSDYAFVIAFKEKLNSN